MSVLDKISRLVSGLAERGAREATEALLDCYVECIRRAQQLSRHAEMAPQTYGMEGLRQLAAAEGAQAERLRAALRAASTALPPPPPDTLPPGALNHWGRLVQDLEAHQASFRRLRELAVRFAESLPATAELFDQLCAEEHVHCERLRELIARADPQALD